jgi:hypothetical protein
MNRDFNIGSTSPSNSGILEAALTTEKRNNMKTDTFGIPSERKYPLNDKKHVLSAITYFNKCDSSKEEELAKNIKKRMKELHMTVNVSKDNRFSKYYKTPEKKEATKESVDLFGEPRKYEPIEEQIHIETEETVVEEKAVDKDKKEDKKPSFIDKLKEKKKEHDDAKAAKEMEDDDEDLDENFAPPVSSIDVITLCNEAYFNSKAVLRDYAREHKI